MKLKDALNKISIRINIDNYLIFKALISARKTTCPVIAQVSEGEAEFLGLDNFFQMVRFQNLKDFRSSPYRPWGKWKLSAAIIWGLTWSTMLP